MNSDECIHLGRHFRVRELEKVRFRKRKRPALYRNRSPLMNLRGSSQISELLP